MPDTLPAHYDIVEIDGDEWIIVAVDKEEAIWTVYNKLLDLFKIVHFDENTNYTWLTVREL